MRAARVCSTPSDCLAYSYACPDVVLANGSTRTVAGLKACAADFLAFPCEKLNNGEFPACVTAGTLAVGATCEYGSQCASLDCVHIGPGCGTCVTELKLGDDCSAPNTRCGGLTVCQSGHCVTSDATQGGERSLDQECATAGVTCVNSFCSATTKQCVALPKVGASCTEAKRCADGYCSSSTQMCTAYPGLNQPCGVDVSSGGFAYACAPDFVCSTLMQPSGTCVAAPVAGQPCFEGSVTSINGDCDATAHCDYLQSPHLCVAQGGLGVSCRGTFECQSGRTARARMARTRARPTLAIAWGLPVTHAARRT